MKLLKFGGTSLANAEKFLCVADILEKNAKKEKIAVVLSAPAKITNYLVKSIEKITDDGNVIDNIHLAEKIFITLIQEVSKIQSNFYYQSIKQIIQKEFTALKKIIHGIKILKQCPDNIRAIIISRGEILSVAIMRHILESRKYRITVINPIKKLVSQGHYLDSSVNIKKSKKRIKNININQVDILLMAGFIAGNEKEELVVLGRNGSDYSAAILAACLDANACEIWTDVDGVFTCDPREVPNAYLLESISYQEAMELSYFGAKVLHPRTIEPISQFNIPCFIKNTANTQAKGTLIQKNDRFDQNILKGVTHLDNISMFTIDGPGIKNITNIISRIFTSVSQKHIRIILMTQASSAHTITFCILENDTNIVNNVLIEEFSLEFKEKILHPINILKNLSILSIVGSDIQNKYNIAAKIFNVLGAAKINVLAIAQGSSKNSISLVVNKKHTLNGTKIIHDVLFSKKKVITVFLIGIGGVGSTLITQISHQKHFLQKKNIKINICLIANSTKMLFSENGIDSSNWKNHFDKSRDTFSLIKLFNIIKTFHFVNPTIIDCTADQLLSEQYVIFLKNGLNVVTSNKKANTNNWQYYQNIRTTMLDTNKKFLYNTNVGAGLPIISTLQNLLNTGDRIIRCTGILSGSLSFIFGKIEEGMLLSQATQLAQELGFTEPNPCDDLSGIDVARKILILAREMGYQKELHDIVINPILPKNFNTTASKNDIFLQIQSFDAYFLSKINAAKKLGNVLRFVGTIDNTGHCTVNIESIHSNDPLYKVKNGENVLAFYSTHYQPIPLVLKGYGAGNDVTASGMFSDLLHTLS